MHLSIVKIQNTAKNPTEISFQNVGSEFIEKVTKDLDPEKSAPQNHIPVKIFKYIADKIFNEN